MEAGRGAAAAGDVAIPWRRGQRSIVARAPRSAVDRLSGADVEALLEMACREGGRFHASLRRIVTKAGAAYKPGPRKKRDRIVEKARSDYDGDVARVVDVERATGVCDSLAALSRVVRKLAGASDAGELKILRVKDSFFKDVKESGYRDLKFFVGVSGFVGELHVSPRGYSPDESRRRRRWDADILRRRATPRPGRPARASGS